MRNLCFVLFRCVSHNFAQFKNIPTCFLTYTLLAVDPQAPFTDADGNAISDVAVNAAGADALIQWFLSQEALDLARL